MSSREPELYKDKIEVSLDGRQIFYLFFGGAVLVGMVFVLGVMVGRRVESRSHVDGLSRDHDRTASDPLAALDGLEARKLTFHDHLTKAPPRTLVDAKIDELEHQRADAPITAPSPKLEVKPEPAKPNGAKPAKPDKPDKPDKSDKPDKPAKPAKLAKAAKADKPEKLAKADKPKADDKKLDETKPKKAKSEKSEKLAKRDDQKNAPINRDVVTAPDVPVTRPEARPAKPDKPEKAAGRAEKAKFTLQLSSFQDKKEAEAFLSSVKSAGYQAYVMEAEVSGKQYFRVRLGRYGSIDAANDAKVDIEKAIKKTASVMRL